MAVATLTSKGQITIPADIRARFNLATGTKVEFLVSATGELLLRPRTGDVRALKGAIAYAGPSVSIEDMNSAIGEAAAAAFRRSVG